MERFMLLSKPKRTAVVGMMDNTSDHTFESANRVYGKRACFPTINTCGGGGLQAKVIKLRKVGQMETLEEYKDGWDQEIVQEEAEDVSGESLDKYLYTASDGEQYGIFKLSPRECLRLMDVRDEDIDKMLAVNSKTQCYKQAGNSIVVNVLSAIFSQLNIQGITPWNERNHKERLDLLGFKHEKGEIDG